MTFTCDDRVDGKWFLTTVENDFTPAFNPITGPQLTVNEIVEKLEEFPIRSTDLPFNHFRDPLTEAHLDQFSIEVISAPSFTQLLAHPEVTRTVDVWTIDIDGYEIFSGDDVAMDIFGNLYRQVHCEFQRKTRQGVRDLLVGPENTVAILPVEYRVAAGGSVRGEMGIKNTVLDGERHEFILNMLPASADDLILAANSCTTLETCDRLKTQMGSWIIYLKIPRAIAANMNGIISFTIMPSEDAIEGTYTFTAVACYDQNGSSPVAAQCTSEAANLWGTPQELILTIR